MNPPVNTAPPSLIGPQPLRPSDSVECTPGEWQEATTLDYQWLRGGVEIPFAVGAHYSIQDVDLGLDISCRVKARNLAYIEGVDVVSSSIPTRYDAWLHPSPDWLLETQGPSTLVPVHAFPGPVSGWHSRHEGYAVADHEPLFPAPELANGREGLLFFEHSTSYSRIDLSTPGPAGDFTLVFVLRPNSAANMPLWACGVPGQEDMRVRIDADHSVRFSRDGVSSHAVSAVPLVPGQVSRVMVSYTSGTATVRVEGGEPESIQVSSGGGSVEDSWLGTKHDNSQVFSGTLYAVGQYDRALIGAEAEAVWSSLGSRFLGIDPPSALVQDGLVYEAGDGGQGYVSALSGPKWTIFGAVHPTPPSYYLTNNVMRVCEFTGPEADLLRINVTTVNAKQTVVLSVNGQNVAAMVDQVPWLKTAAGVSVRFAFTFDGTHYSAVENGRAGQTTPAISALTTVDSLSIGSPDIRVDSLAVYDRALTPEEIDHNNTATLPLATEFSSAHGYGVLICGQSNADYLEGNDEWEFDGETFADVPLQNVAFPAQSLQNLSYGSPTRHWEPAEDVLKHFKGLRLYAIWNQGESDSGGSGNYAQASTWGSRFEAYRRRVEILALAAGVVSVTWIIELFNVNWNQELGYIIRAHQDAAVAGYAHIYGQNNDDLLPDGTGFHYQTGDLSTRRSRIESLVLGLEA